MKKRILLRLLVAATFLLAQQAALAHQIWHAAGEPAKSSQNRLCDQHAALGTVLGAVNGSTTFALLVEPAPIHFPAAHAPAASASALPPASRGPPSVS